MLAAVEEVVETDNGFAVRVGADRVELAEWIAFERLCYPFLRVRLAIEGNGPVRWELGGGEGVKDFLGEEFSALGSAKLVSPASLVRGR